MHLQSSASTGGHFAKCPPAMSSTVLATQQDLETPSFFKCPTTGDSRSLHPLANGRIMAKKTGDMVKTSLIYR